MGEMNQEAAAEIGRIIGEVKKGVRDGATMMGAVS